MLGLLSTLFEMNTERSCVAPQRKRSDRGRFSSHKNWRSWGKRSRWRRRLSPESIRCWETFFFHGCVLTAGVSGDAKTVGHPAPAGAGEGEADASGAAEAHHPDESPNACVLPALCPGTITNSHRIKQCNSIDGCAGKSKSDYTWQWLYVNADAVFATQCGRRGGVPTWSSTQLPRHLQSSRFCGGFADAQHLHEPAWADGYTTVPSYAWGCHRWGI